MDGFLVIDKPGGMSSQQVVTCVKRSCGVRRAGHTGTLDPLATGVLVVALGRATRLIPFLDEGVKGYEGELCLGVETDTYDADGTVVCRYRGEINLARAEIAAAAAAFTGGIDQVPPVFSAIKHQGKPLYRLARQGRPVVPPSRRVTVERFTIDSVDLPRATFTVVCSRGTYVRSLVHDLGRRLDCGAILTRLRRTQSGPFRIAAAVSLVAIEEGGAAVGAATLIPPAAVLDGWPTVRLGDERQLDLVVHGQPLEVPEAAVENLCDGALTRLLDDAGRLVAVAAATLTEAGVELRIKRGFMG
ncbi:MAG: tRNA pseudouridine(55) synthase TruB [Deltaproteobacteria bacterium]|nr:tRNA pseudouridine(55) synthase TruB [Candidatus Anaeroferrophillacea bacterium]